MRRSSWLMSCVSGLWLCQFGLLSTQGDKFALFRDLKTRAHTVSWFRPCNFQWEKTTCILYLFYASASGPKRTGGESEINKTVITQISIWWLTTLPAIPKWRKLSFPYFTARNCLKIVPAIILYRNHPKRTLFFALISLRQQNKSQPEMRKLYTTPI